MRIPLWLKIAWTIWLIVWAPLYWRQYGAQNFLYFCDIGNVLIGIALWLESPLIFSWAACGLLLFQSLYTIDLAGALITGHHPIGGTEYMFDPHLPLGVRLLSLFHVVTPPLLLWAIWRLGYDSRGWKLQTLTCWIVVPINYFWRPEQNVNWARGLILPRTACNSRLGLLAGLPDRGTAVHLLADAPSAAAATEPPEIVTRVSHKSWVAQGFKFGDKPGSYQDTASAVPYYCRIDVAFRRCG